MSKTQKRVSALLAMAALTCTATIAVAQPSVGADVIVGDLPSAANNTPAAGDTGWDSFAIGTTSCNRGDKELLWISGTNQHPVIGQNLFRLYNGRFEQIGQAWLKHGFTALQGTECAGDPGFPYATCANSGTGARLGLGCSDPYSAGLNNGQSGLGPKWQVNAAKGVFPYPFANPTFTGQVARRLAVQVTEMDPASFPGARYFVEGQYVVPDDAATGNGFNSASYREVTIAAVAGSGTPPQNFNMTATAATARELPAIYAWQAIDNTVQINTATIANDGRFILACKVTGPVSGVYTYEYALHNLNSDRCAGSFSVPYPNGTAISNIGFRDVIYRDGEANDSPANPATDNWTSTTSATSVTWAGAAYNGTPATYTISGANANPAQSYLLSAWTAGTGNDHTANVLRWGTMFNFRFTTTVAPAQGQIQIGLWRPGTPSAVTMAIQTPGGATTGTASTGPCCVGTTCTVTTQAACSGTFGTIGASCTPNPCLVTPTGACCNAGVCAITTQAGCSATYQGDNTTCTPNPCPQPTGACCVGTACSVVTQAACTGVYLGNGVGCTANICASNDLCSGAIPLCAGVAANGNNTTATTNTTVTCTTNQREVWFSYIPATSGNLSIAVDGVSGTTMTDSVLAVWSACGGTQLACDDDSGTGLFSLISTFAATAGTPYYISVGSFNNTAGGSFTVTVTGGGGTGCNPPNGSCCNAGACSITTQAACSGTWTTGGTCSPNPCVTNGSCCAADTSCTVTAQSGCVTGTWTANGTCTPNICVPSNDLCANRPGVGLGSTPFTTVNATTDGIAHNPTCLFFNNDQITNDVWFNHPSGATGSLRIDTCGSGFDTKIAVYLGYGCADYATRLIACDDDNTTVCGSGTQSAVTINVVAGEHYTIRVGGYNGATGTGVLNLTFTPTATGACCATDGSCSVTTTAGCNGGTYQGDNTTCSPNPCPQPTGACCATNGTCSVTTSAACTGTFQGTGTTCSPNPCPQPQGACCVGTTCTSTTQSQCTGSWQGASSTCGAPGNPTTCCRANFNGANGVSVQDIFDFLSAWFAGQPSADINGANGVTVQDIFDFLALWFAGCPG